MWGAMIKINIKIISGKMFNLRHEEEYYIECTQHPNTSINRHIYMYTRELLLFQKQGFNWSLLISKPKTLL